MSTAAILCSQIDRSLNTLKKECGSFGKKNIKTLITESQKMLEQNKENPQAIDLDIISKPFFLAYNEYRRELLPVVLDYFAIIFQYSSHDLLPKAKLTKKVIELLFTLHKKYPQVPDEIKSKIPKIIQSIFESLSSKFFIHFDLLGKVFQFLFNLQSSCEGTPVSEIIGMTIQNAFRSFIENYQKPFPSPNFSTVEEISHYYVNHIIENSIAVMSTMSEYQNITLDDSDIIIIVKAFSKAIEKLTHKKSTIRTLCESLIILLESDCPFLSKPAFASLLQTDIHVALIGLCLDSHRELAKPTARLIAEVWRRFPQLYLNGLNEVLSQGLLTALQSPYPRVAVRAILIFAELAKEPQLMVDMFVNYDCDQSGFFQNVYNTIINQVVRHSKPGQDDPDLQRAGIAALITFLENLWEYFVMMSKTREESPDAKSYLDAKRAKDVFDRGLQIFKSSEKKGLRFFIENEIVSKEPDRIAEFFFNTPTLSPESIGQIIGGSDELNQEILRSYMKLFDFKGLTFAQAFRAFLGKFHIPGESQQIDRIMEQFGSKYYNDNPGIFSCAETVYVIAFSALMLHTDAHHPTIKKHMTLDEFIANNRGLDNGQDLPRDFQVELYKDITSKKIFVSANALPASGLLTREQRADMYKQQCSQALAAARERTNNTKGLVFHRPESALLVGPMFKTVWAPILAALTMSFEATDEESIIERCLKGFQLCLHIASRCYVEEALDTLVDSFAKFTRLRQKRLEEVKGKNIECTRALIDCAIEDHNYLKGVWTIVLGEISAIDYLKDRREFNRFQLLADELFNLSSSLDRESIMDFVRALCNVAHDELNEDPPRHFSLLKLVDVSNTNMNRELFVWKDVWEIIGEFLSTEGSSSNEAVALTTINLLRQLAREFIPKQDKSSQIHLQAHFLQPFFDIFTRTQSTSIREMILDSTQQLIQTFASVLHKGWDVIFQILRLAATDERLRKRGFEIVEKITNNHMTTIVPHVLHFEMVLPSFATSDGSGELAVNVPQIFKVIADSIPSEPEDAWICLLQSLAKCEAHPLLSVKVATENALIELIADKGCQRGAFIPAVWEYLFTEEMVSLFEFEEGSMPEFFAHLAEFLVRFFKEVVLAFPAVVAPYIALIVRSVSKIAERGNDFFKQSALGTLASFLNTQTEASEELIDEFTKTAKVMEESCKHLCAFSDFISALIGLFEQHKRVYDDLMPVLKSIFDNEELAPEVRNQARGHYMERLIKAGDAENASAFFIDVIERTKTGSATDNHLCASAMGSLADADDAVFKVCAEAAMPLLCDAIEYDNAAVRLQLIRVMKRALE